MFQPKLDASDTLDSTSRIYIADYKTSIYFGLRRFRLIIGLARAMQRPPTYLANKCTLKRT